MKLLPRVRPDNLHRICLMASIAAAVVLITACGGGGDATTPEADGSADPTAVRVDSSLSTSQVARMQAPGVRKVQP